MKAPAEMSPLKLSVNLDGVYAAREVSTALATLERAAYNLAQTIRPMGKSLVLTIRVEEQGVIEPIAVDDGYVR